MTRRLAFYIQLTADGMYADEEGGLGDVEPAEDEHRYANGLMRDTGDLVMGRVMYGVMDYWDELDLDDPATSDVEREFATVLARDAKARRLPRPTRAAAERLPARGRRRRGDPHDEGR